LYIVDQGRTRIAKFDPVAESFTVWGTGGSNQGEFNEATGIAIGGDLVYVADAGNMRMQVFDLNGAFIKQWPVPSWEPSSMHFPDVVYDDVLKRLYVTSGKFNQILAFDLDGNPITGFVGEGSDKLQNPSSIYISGAKSARKLLVLNTGSGNVTAFDLPGKSEK
jgi:tripartite motif-containing protein 71